MGLVSARLDAFVAVRICARSSMIFRCFGVVPLVVSRLALVWHWYRHELTLVHFLAAVSQCIVISFGLYPREVWLLAVFAKVCQDGKDVRHG